jgi:hypothetical protein
MTSAERARRAMLPDYAAKAGRASVASARHHRLSPIDRRRRALPRRAVAVVRRGSWTVLIEVARP